MALMLSSIQEQQQFLKRISKTGCALDNRDYCEHSEALQLMKVGAKWKLYIPAELAYGNSPPGPPIEAGSTLVFDIELLGIEGK